MSFQAQVTVRNAGWLLVQWGAVIVSGFLFAALVPRLMGPEVYGRYALVTSLSQWFILLSTWGFTQVIGRYMPPLILQGKDEERHRLIGGLSAVRVACGVLVAGLYLLLGVFWLRELDPVALGLIAGGVFLGAIVELIFALFLGLNQAARWGMGEILARWITLPMVLSGFYWAGFRGACAGYLLTETAVLALGLWWARSYLAWPSWRLDLSGLAPYLRFGLIFFAGTLLLSAFRRSGEVLVRVITGDYRQVSYFGLAYNVYFVVATAVSQITLVFVPLMTTLRVQGEIESLQRWCELLLKWLAIGGMGLLFAVLVLGDDLVPLVFGSAYQSVAVNLLPLAGSLPLLALASVATLLTLIYDRPALTVQAAAIQLVILWSLGPLLIAWRGSLGACLAAFVTSTLYAGYLTWRMRSLLRYSLEKWAMAVGLGMLFLPLLWLQASWVVNVGLYGLFVAGYGGALFLLRVVKPDEMASLWHTLKQPVTE